MASSAWVEKPPKKHPPLTKSCVPELNAIKEVASRTLFAADRMKNLMCAGPPRPLPTGSGPDESPHSRPLLPKSRPLSMTPNGATSSVAASGQEHCVPNGTIVQSKEKTAKTSRWKIYTPDSSIRKTSPCKTQHSMLPDNSMRHAEGQTLDLDVIAELQELIVAPERSSAQSLPSLTTEQALALLELINKVIRPR